MKNARWLVSATVLLLVFSVTGWRVTRAEGGVLLAAYIAYVGYLASIAISP